MANNPKARDNLILLKKWETANPNWRPKKGIWLVNDDLKAKWYNPATKQDIELNYMSLLQLSQKELTELWKDESKPMLIRIIVKNMLWWKGFDIIEKMLDRWIWKSMPKDNNGNDKEYTFIIKP